MAIQIRRGTNTEWESNNSNIVVGEPAIATDAERFFVGTASGDYAEFANLDIIAPAYDTSASYVVGDVINRHGKLYSCNTPCSGTFNSSYWDEKSLAEILKDLESEINYAQYEIGYADGELITINNGASEIPVKDLTLDIEAVQDLHGYDHPWVGGAWKNLLDIGSRVNQTTASIVYTSDDNYITMNGTKSGGGYANLSDLTISLEAGTYYARAFAISGTTTYNPYIYLFDGTTNLNTSNMLGAEREITIDTAKTCTIRVGVFTDGAVFTNFKIGIVISNTSGIDKFYPYSNICPISGWDEVNVTRTGKNLLPIIDTPTYSGLTIIKNNDGSYNITGKPNSNGSIEFYNDVLNPIRITEPCIFTSGWNPQGKATIIFSTAESSVAIQSSNSDTLNIPIGEYTRFRIYVNSANTYNFTFKPMVRLATESDATYHAYNGQTYTIDLDGTRYGGTLDVTTGVLTVTHGFKIYDGTETWGAELTANFYSPSGRGASSVYILGDKLWCSHAPSLVASASVSYLNCYISTTGNFNIQIPNSIVPHTATDMKSWVTAQYNNGTPLTIRYELVTPQVVQLTPTQVRTLLGTNNLWNQMNSNNELAYRISNALN